MLMVLLAAGQVSGQPSGTRLAEQNPVIGALTAEIETLSGEIATSGDDDARLLEIRLRLEEIGSLLSETTESLTPRLDEIRNRLEQLGPAPAPDQPPEPEAIAEERNELARERAEINALIGEADKAADAVRGLIVRIAELRRDLFTRTLTQRYDLSGILDPAILSSFASEFGDLRRLFDGWFRSVAGERLRSALLAALLSFAAATVLFVFGRRLVLPMLIADPATEHPSYLSRLTVAFWSTLLPVLALIVFFGLTLVLYTALGVLPAGIGEILRIGFGVITVVFFIHRLSHAVLKPQLPNWRLVPVNDKAARLLVWLASATALMTAVDFLMSRVYGVLGSPLDLIVASNLVSNIVVGLFVILIGSVRPLSDGKGGSRRWPAIIRIPLYGIGAVTIAITLLGYVGLASFISQQIVITGGILVTMYLGFLSAGAVSAEGAFQQTVLGRRMGRFFGISEPAVDRFGLLSGLSVYLLILVLGIPVILMTWGFQFSEIRVWVIRLFSQISIGSVSFSIGGILTGLMVFFLGFLATRWFQRWIDGSVLSRSRIDTGVRNSVRVAIGYAGIAVAALIGLSAAGINLSNLALVAGALSLGIGFGLQNIVSNFVSGLILLAERPFKVGDWIIAGSVEGTVKRINVRATEIETFRRQTVILPNSELINQPVSNWTHRNKLGRLDIPVSVAYGSDVRKVREILLGLASGHPMVIKNPEPVVAFTSFGESSLDFEVRMFLYDIMNSVTVQNDIRFGIVEAFEREKVEIPFPQRDVHIRSGLEGLGGNGGPHGETEGDEAARSARRRKRKPPMVT
jgi:small-conductance mechanosensitive channel